MKWVAAFVLYALAAEAAEVWTYTSAKAHLRICQQIACEQLSSSCRRLALRVAAFVAEAVRQQKEGAINSLRCTMRLAARNGLSVRPGVRQVSAPLCFVVLACSICEATLISMSMMPVADLIMSFLSKLAQPMMRKWLPSQGLPRKALPVMLHQVLRTTVRQSACAATACTHFVGMQVRPCISSSVAKSALGETISRMVTKAMAASPRAEEILGKKPNWGYGKSW